MEGGDQIMLHRWLQALGYDAGGDALHLPGRVSVQHPYALEIQSVLDPAGDIRAKAVFDVEGVPTVVFVERNSERPLDSHALDQLRQQIWNQNLLSVVLVFDTDRMVPYPVTRSATPADAFKLDIASADGHYSAADIRSSEIQQRHPDWFKAENRVDQQLLRNLGSAVKLLTQTGLGRADAQALLGQIMFIAYLEHRGIVGDTYRADRGVEALAGLVAERDGQAIDALVNKLRGDFNGDFLSAAAGEPLWPALSNEAFQVLHDFLHRVDLETGQGDFWNYDFRYIPVELLSGIYETFLDEERTELAAYYTPRHLANLAIDQAFAPSEDILDEVIYDGACGSGILLTTAFRRMLGVAEARRGAQLSLAERIELLREHIFGSDISDAACRVTAFSLYLSLLERLEPSDILALQHDEAVKLPRLREQNLFSGPTKGDFFSTENPLSESGRFTLVISNPPWREPAGTERSHADEYAEKAQLPPSRRQVAGVFAFRALDALAENGRLCLIMPVSMFLARTSESFVQRWFQRCRPTRLTNFGDLQQLLFDASHGCVIVNAKTRDECTVPIDETFEYWVPKADISLLLGRLSLQSADRHRLQTQAVQDDPSSLVTFMWGDQSDLALWSRLTLRGTLGDRLAGRNKRWTYRKGIHFKDRSRGSESAKPLHDMPYVSTEALKFRLPVLHDELVTRFPEDVDTVAHIGDATAVFDGPRVLFPDGMDNSREIRAAYYEQPASFKSSIGVIAGPKSDSDELKFLALYLRSELATYFLLTHSYQVLCERNRVALDEIRQFPYVGPDEHANPDKARTIVAEAIELVDNFKRRGVDQQVLAYENQRARLNELVFDYFTLTSEERQLVSESVRHLLTAARPRSHKRLFTGLQRRASKEQMNSYVARLQAELAAWRTKLGGEGRIDVSVVYQPMRSSGPIGVVRVSVEATAEQSPASLRQSGDAVAETLARLDELKLMPTPGVFGTQLFPDTLIWHENHVYLVRPLIVRSWLERAAVRDARNIVAELHTAIPEQQRAAS